jgi:hypothetical protein
MDVIEYLMASFTILFVGLKLCHIIDWSWWWIFSPIWAPFVGILAAVIFMVTITAIGMGFWWLIKKIFHIKVED